MTERSFVIIVIVTVVFLAAVSYVNTLDGDWVWDDASSVLINKNIQDASNFTQLFREDQHAFGRGQGNFYRPLVSLSFMLDFALSHDPALDGTLADGTLDVKPLFFHLTNLFWHMATALLLFALLGRMDAPRFVRAVVPLLYVVHPLHTEAVAYMSGRADMMSAAFMFAGACLALEEGRLARRGVCWFLSSLCFCAALLSKESSLIYPFLLLILLLFRPVPSAFAGREKQAYVLRAVPLIISLTIVAVYGILRMSALKFAESNPANTSPLGQRLVETGQAMAFYVKMLFLPMKLHMEQSLNGTPLWSAFLGGLVILLCIGSIVVALRSGHRRIAMGLGWFLVAWFPISGIFPLNAPMAEHWMYVPMAGFWWACAEALNHVTQNPRGRRFALAAMYGLGLFFVVITVQRNQEWHNNESLFRATLRENPASVRVHYNLAVAYGDLEKNYPGARRHYDAVLWLRQLDRPKAPGDESGNVPLMEEDIDVQLSLGLVSLQQREYQRAARHFSVLQGLQGNAGHQKEFAIANMGLVRCYLALGDVPQALRLFQQVLGVTDDGLKPVLQAEMEALLRGAPIHETG
jgi:hypothetical protein